MKVNIQIAVEDGYSPSASVTAYGIMSPGDAEYLVAAKRGVAQILKDWNARKKGAKTVEVVKEK